MSKKTAKTNTPTVVIPDVWKNLTKPVKQIAAYTVVVDIANNIHTGDKATMDKHFPTGVPVGARWDGMEEYLTKTNKQTKLAYHEQFVGAVPEGVDETEIGYMTWAWFAKNGTPHIVGTTASGEKARKSSLGTRKYEVCKADGVPKTPQAQACLKILRETLNKDGHISEEELKNAIEARAAELKTKQDPWRIFQYYRPTLVKGGFIKHD